MFSPRFLFRWAIVLIAFCFVEARPQQRCTLKLNELPDAPELYGFRLGMTREEARAKTPLIKFGLPNEFGLIKTSINPSYDPRFDQSAFAGVRTISLDFLDDKLVTLWIGYDEKFKWQNIDDFAVGMRASLKLPSSFTVKRNGKELSCDGFSIFVSIIAGSPSIRITDDAAQEAIDARREEAAAAVDLAVFGDKSTKLFFSKDCQSSETIVDANRVTFKSKEDAEKAGYKPAKSCQ